MTAAARVRPALALAAPYAAVILAYVAVRRGMLDEGWYLLAGKLAWRGEVPILDFAYFQAPLLPYLYGAGQQWAPGILAGRLTAAACALAAGWIAVDWAGRLGGRAAAGWTAALLAACVYFVSHFPLALTYGPAAFLLVAAARAAWSGRIIAAVLLATAAAGVRFSLAPCLPALAAYAYARSPRGPSRAPRLALACLPAAAGLLAAGLHLERVWFCLAGYHLDGAGAADRVRAVATSLGDAALLAAPLLVAAAAARPRALVWLLTALFAANLVPRTTAAYYQSVLVPLACVLAGARLAAMPARRGFAAVGLLLALQIRGVAGNDVLAPPARLASLRDAGAELRALAGSGHARVWTLAPAIAVEAGLDVLPGMEMGIFAVQPGWPRARCERFGVVNPEMLRDSIARGAAEVVVVTPLDAARLGGTEGPVLQALRGRYRFAARWDDLGQFDGPTVVFVRHAQRRTSSNRWRRDRPARA